MGILIIQGNWSQTNFVRKQKNRHLPLGQMPVFISLEIGYRALSAEENIGQIGDNLRKDHKYGKSQDLDGDKR